MSRTDAATGWRAVSSTTRARWLTGGLVLADIVGFSLAWLATWKLRQVANPYFWEPINPIADYIQALKYLLPFWILITAVHGHYAHRERMSSLNEVTRLLRATEEMWLATFIVAYMLRHLEPGRAVVLAMVVPLFIYLYTSRTILRSIKRRATRLGRNLKRVLIVGTGETARRAMLRIVDHPEVGYELVGLVGRTEKRPVKGANHAPYLGSIDNLVDIIRTYHVDEVFLADPNIPDNDKLNLVVRCDETRVTFKIVSQMFEVVNPQIRIDVVDDLPVIPLQAGGLGTFAAFFKRTIDIAVDTSAALRGGHRALDPVRRRPPGHLCPRPDRPQRPAFPDLEIPHDEPRHEPVRQRASRSQGPAHHAFGPIPAPHEPRRDAATLERPARRNEHGRPASRNAADRRALRALAAHPPRSQTRRHRPLADHRPQEPSP
jgi:hypothetical protein